MYMTLKESLLDNDKDIRANLESEAKSLITKWLLKYAYVSTRTSFRKIEIKDFNIDDKDLISIDGNKDLRGISLLHIDTIPEYIRFSYVNKEFKISVASTDKGDASFLLKNLTKQGIKDLTYILVEGTNFKTLGDLSDLEVYTFHVHHNEYLQMKVSELPKIIVSIKYTGNKNTFDYKEIRRKLDSDATLYILDNKNNVVDESLLDSDDTIKEKKDRYYYIALFAKCLVDVYKNKFDFSHIYSDKRYDGVYIIPKSQEEKHIQELFKTDQTDVGPTSKYMKELLTPIVKKLYLEKSTKHKEPSNVCHVRNYWFTSIRIGNTSTLDSPDDKVHIYVSVGVRQYNDKSIMMELDLGEEELNKKLIEYLKRIR